MIKRLINNGFKDQTRTVHFSGLDLFTSDDVNGVGKSAVLEAFKLALVGEIPGRAKNVDDILQFTSLDEIKVEILADTYRGPVSFTRRFLRFAPRGEKRPISINGIDKQFEQGSHWIRRHIGAVSISFDPFEFLNLSDAKKRQWIIAHSPESQGPGQTALYTLLLAWMVQNLLGTGIVYSLLTTFGSNSLNDFCREAHAEKLARLNDRLLDVIHQQEPGLSALLEKTLDGVFSHGSASCSGEESSNAMLRHLKSETLRLKNAVREKSLALACMDPASETKAVSGEGDGIFAFQRDIKCLNKDMEALDRRLEKIQNQQATKIKWQERINYLKGNISRLKEKLDTGMIDALTSRRQQLHGKRVDLNDLQEKLKVFNRDLSVCSSEYQGQESERKRLTGAIKLKRDKLEHLSSAHFACPVASEIRCETDMTPYREILARDIESLQLKEKEKFSSCEMARQKLTACDIKIDQLDLKLTDQLSSNREIQREIDLVQEQIQREENETARILGRLAAHREEVSALEAEPELLPEDEGGAEILEDQKRALLSRMQEKQKSLDEGLRRQGKSEALFELRKQKKLAERELAIVKKTHDLLGSMQRDMAVCIAGALETEVNDVLKLIDSDYHFSLNLTGKNFEMGWNRDGRIIPFKTINSAHFVIFIVPFLAALIQRLARTRDKMGLPTLKALCVETESLTPENLSALLKGLKHMKEKGVLDNVLVAHYHSLRMPEKLSGFQEHILEEILP